jgi:type I restriction enzyme S subunit
MKAVEDANRWQTKSLRDLATINYGRSPAAILAEDGLYPVVGTGGSERRGNDYLHEGESIILGRKGTIDRVYFATGRFWTIDTAYYLTDFTESVPRWLYYFLQTIDLRQMNEATGVPSLSRDLLYKIEIQTPPKPEQTKIAEVLSTVDRAIEQTEALIAKQQRIKTGLMQDLLTRGIDEHGNLRTEQTHKFKDSPLGRIPVEWEVKPLGQVSNLITNGFVGVATPHYTESSEGIPYLYGNNVRNNYVDLTKVTLINRSFYSKQHKSQLQPGDMLTVQSGHIGTTAVVPDSLSESNCHALIITKFKKEMLSPDFVSLYCNFCLETGSMSHLFIGSTIKHINTSDFAKFAIPFPPKYEQFQIAHRLLDLINMVNVAGAELTKLRFLKTALMQDLLTGKKRVTGLLDDTEVTVQ